MSRRYWAPQTVGELKAVLAGLPDDMPLHHHGNVGDHPRGLLLAVFRLAAHKEDAGYFADMTPGSHWADPKYEGSFDTPFDALST